jgi:methionyl aminopeptidase
VSGVVLKSPAEIEILDQANRIVQELLDELEGRIRPGMTTLEIDSFAEQRIREAGGSPAFKGYPHRGDGKDFPGTVCASVNSEVVHGVPSARVALVEGDTISIDLGVLYKGYYGDGARTFPVGKISEEDARLLDVTREALHLGIEQARVGNRVADIGHAVQKHVEAAGFSVVREFVGHGIGAALHEEPQVPNFGQPGRRERLEVGLVLAIEPMVNAGGPEVLLSAEDGWTARTRDGSRSAHFECCVAVTADGPRVLGRGALRKVARGAERVERAGTK